MSTDFGNRNNQYKIMMGVSQNNIMSLQGRQDGLKIIFYNIFSLILISQPQIFSAVIKHDQVDNSFYSTQPFCLKIKNKNLLRHTA